MGGDGGVEGSGQSRLTREGGGPKPPASQDRRGHGGVFMVGLRSPFPIAK